MATTKPATKKKPSKKTEPPLELPLATETETPVPEPFEITPSPEFVELAKGFEEQKTDKEPDAEVRPAEPAVEGPVDPEFELVMEEPTTKSMKSVKLGRTARKAIDCVIEATKNGEPIHARTLSERTEIKMGQARSLLRSFRDDGLVVLLPPAAADDRVYRYEAVAGLEARLALGDEERARKPSSTYTPIADVPPMDVELYTPLALKLAAIDRAIVRWTGTAYRDRKAIRVAGKDPDQADTWPKRTIEIAGEVREIVAPDVGPWLRDLRKLIMTPEFRSAQKVADRELIKVLEGDDNSDENGEEG